MAKFDCSAKIKNYGDVLFLDDFKALLDHCNEMENVMFILTKEKVNDNIEYSLNAAPLDKLNSGDELVVKVKNCEILQVK